MQVAIYCVLRDQIFIPPVTSPRGTFFSFNVVLDSVGRYVSKDPMKSLSKCKNELDYIFI